MLSDKFTGGEGKDFYRDLQHVRLHPDGTITEVRDSSGIPRGLPFPNKRAPWNPDLGGEDYLRALDFQTLVERLREALAVAAVANAEAICPGCYLGDDAPDAHDCNV